jgi:hypothetical protein
LCADPAAEVWGVLYKITRRDLVRLYVTEGIPWWRYWPLWLDAEDISGIALQAATYIAQGDEDDRNPSFRYLTLLREGARAHGLPEHYIRFLEQIEHVRQPRALFAIERQINKLSVTKKYSAFTVSAAANHLRLERPSAARGAHSGSRHTLDINQKALRPAKRGGGAIWWGIFRKARINEPPGQR